jgi:H+/Cl- antiporter ClcA
VSFVVALAVWAASLVEGRPGDFTVSSVPEGILVFAVFGLPLAYLGELLLGIPAWLLFKRYGVRSYFAFAAGGAFLGLLFYVGTDVLTGNFKTLPSPNEFNPIRSAYLDLDIASAMAAAIIFRAIVFSKQRQEATNPHPGVPSE